MGVAELSNESAQTLTVTAVGTPLHGSAVIIGSGANAGKVLYTPAADYNGPDSFSYTVTDNGTTNGSPDPRSDTNGLVSDRESTGNNSRHAGLANPTLAEDSTVGVNAACNDVVGPIHGPARSTTFPSATLFRSGSAVIIGSGANAGKVLYTPAADYNGPDSFSYTVTDNGTTNGSPDPRSDTNGLV